MNELGLPHGGIVDAGYGSGLSFRDPDNIALEFLRTSVPMTTFQRVRFAAVQATPVLLDADATIDKALRLIGGAARAGPGWSFSRSASP